MTQTKTAKVVGLFVAAALTISGCSSGAMTTIAMTRTMMDIVMMAGAVRDRAPLTITIPAAVKTRAAHQASAAVPRAASAAPERPVRGER